MREIVIVVVVGLTMFALRTSFILLAGDRQMPAWLAGALDHLKPAAFGALTATMMVTHEGVGPAHLAAVGLVFLLARRGLDLTLALLAGMLLVGVAGLIG
jgi:branched-subunit amino acid transport protein